MLKAVFDLNHNFIIHTAFALQRLCLTPCKPDIMTIQELQKVDFSCGGILALFLNSVFLFRPLWYVFHYMYAASWGHQKSFMKEIVKEGCSVFDLSASRWTRRRSSSLLEFEQKLRKTAEYYVSQNP